MSFFHSHLLSAAVALAVVPVTMSAIGIIARQSPNEDVALRQGRAIVAQALAKNTDALVARFNPTMKQQFTRAQIDSLLQQLFGSGRTPGERLDETVSDVQGFPAYIATYAYGAPGKALIITVVLDGSDNSAKIAGLMFKPGDAPAPAPQTTLSPAQEDGVRQAGRSVAALISKKAVDTLFARFTPQMAKSVPKTQIAAGVKEVAPLGERVTETIAPSRNPALVRYTAVHRWQNTRTLTLTVDFVMGSGGKIAGLSMVPGPMKELPPDPHAGYKMKTPLDLPFSPGTTWTVVWGGDTQKQNYHVVSPSQRHAFDFLIVKDDKTHSGDGKEASQYYAWGQPILAPAPGTVVQVENDMPDQKPGKPSEPKRPAGNHVLLDMGNNEYALFAHLQKGSIRVKKGDKVTAGQTLGLCGNSGNTSEPHLHFHVQDKPYLFEDALGLPAVFVGYVSDGKNVSHGSPVQGETIAAR